MTKPPSAASAPDLKSEVEYLRKLNLALLSLLEKRGLLSAEDVQLVLHSAHRAAYPPTSAPPVGPAMLGTRWVKAQPDKPPRGEEYGSEK